MSRPCFVPRVALSVALCIAPALSCNSTSRSTAHVRTQFAFWSVPGQRTFAIGCARVEAWVARSGKEGIGVSIAARSDAPDCTVLLSEAWLNLPKGAVKAVSLPGPARLSDRERLMYVPIAFDNEAAWNGGERTGELILRFEVGGERRELRQPAIQRIEPILAQPRATRAGPMTIDPITPAEVKAIQPGRMARPVEERTDAAATGTTDARPSPPVLEFPPADGASTTTDGSTAWETGR